MPMTPGCFAGQFKFQARLTELALDAMPDDRMDYKPVEGANSFAHIVRHIATARLFFGSIISGQPSPIDSKSITPETHNTKDKLREALRETAAVFTKTLESLPDARLDEPIKVAFSGVTQPGYGWATISLLHEAEHRGNLVVHLKANGAQPPDVMEQMKQMAAAATA
jgi:uncharacterized damage-inducible protein DinB